nr:hypothetical protein [uncultured Macellibacteroides sp.]
MESIKSRIIRNAVNIPGWSTRRKILVIESDDWGSQRVRSKEDTKALASGGFDFSETSFYQYDGLETDNDILGLLEVLYKYRDKNGSHPVFTLACNVANPDYEKIKATDFKEYNYIPSKKACSEDPARKNVFAIHDEGIRKGMTYPVFHGREHLNVQRWLRMLQAKDPSVTMLFEHGSCNYIYGINKQFLGELPAAFDLEFASDLDYQRKVIADGLELFKQTWGYDSRYFIMPNGPINNQLEQDTYAKGVQFLLGDRRQNEPLGDGQYKKHLRWLGDRNQYGQYYLTRNGFLEPGVMEGDLCVNSLEKALSAVERAFRWYKPAIISSHRINYIGFLNPEIRDKGLKTLDLFLAEVLKRWPDVEFMNSVQLGDLMAKNK